MPDALPATETASLRGASTFPATHDPLPPATAADRLSLDPLRRPSPGSAGRSRPTRNWLVFVAILLGALYLGTTSGPALFDQIEGLYAGAAREMLDRDYAPGTQGQLWRGHWWVPTNDGIPRLQKPPLLYWLEMVSVRVFGPTDFAARLPIALSCLLWFWAVFLLGRRLYGAEVGGTAALMLGTMLGAFIFGHIIMPEPLLAACLTLTFWCFASACLEPARAGGWFTTAWLFMALGSFAKGLHGAGYPLGVAALVAWRYPASRPVWKNLFRPAGVLLFLAITVPWYVAIERQFPGFLRDQIFNEQVGHALNRRFPADSKRVSLLVFWLQHLVYFFPWTLFAPAAAIFWWRRQRREHGPVNGERSDLRRAAESIPGVWLGITAVSILFSALQDYYTMTAWGVIACWFARPWVKPAGPGAPPAVALLPRGLRLLPGGTLIFLGCVATAAGIWLSAHVRAPVAGAALAPSRAIGELDSILDTITAIPVAAWQQLLPLLWGSALTLLLGGAAGTLASLRLRDSAVIPVVGITAAVLLALAGRGMGVMEDEMSLKCAAAVINRRAEPGALVVCQGHPRDNPSAFYYVNRQIFWVDTSPALEFASRDLKIGVDLFLTAADLAQRWTGPDAPQVFLICETADLPRWQRLLNLTDAQSQPLARSGSRILISNR